MTTALSTIALSDINCDAWFSLDAISQDEARLFSWSRAGSMTSDNLRDAAAQCVAIAHKYECAGDAERVTFYRAAAWAATSMIRA